MVDISLAFKEVVDGFVSSAETEEQFQLFPMMGVAAWNLSNHTEDQREELIQVFINRFNCPTFIWNSILIQTREKKYSNYAVESCRCILNSGNGSSVLM
jgi:hypothetical protein